MSISNEVKDNVRLYTGREVGNFPLMTLDLNGELAYLYYRRFKNLKGAGFEILAGYRVNGTLMGGGGFFSRKEESETKAGIVFDRWDILHGPFIQGSIIF